MLRSFIKYAHDQKLLKVDFSERIPKYRSVSQPKLPSTYSREEIIRLINSIDRSSSIGKRDYAIILLADYLANEKGASANTITAYRDTFVLLLSFIRDVKRIKPERLTLDTIKKETIIEFLNWLQKDRGWST
jgi:site-specific recombinase XerD